MLQWRHKDVWLSWLRTSERQPPRLRLNPGCDQVEETDKLRDETDEISCLIVAMYSYAVQASAGRIYGVVAKGEKEGFRVRGNAAEAMFDGRSGHCTPARWPAYKWYGITRISLRIPRFSSLQICKTLPSSARLSLRIHYVQQHHTEDDPTSNHKYPSRAQ